MSNNTTTTWIDSITDERIEDVRRIADRLVRHALAGLGVTTDTDADIVCTRVGAALDAAYTAIAALVEAPNSTANTRVEYSPVVAGSPLWDRGFRRGLHSYAASQFYDENGAGFEVRMRAIYTDADIVCTRVGAAADAGLPSHGFAWDTVPSDTPVIEVTRAWGDIG